MHSISSLSSWWIFNILLGLQNSAAENRAIKAVMASAILSPTVHSCSVFRTNNSEVKMSGHKPLRASHIKAMRTEKSLEELYCIRVERKASEERLKELGVGRWSVWKTGKCKLPWDWHVDQLVYIEEGEVRVVPEGSKHYMSFKAGDLVRYPKWFEADLWFNDFYQERYSFRAYGDD